MPLVLDSEYDIGPRRVFADRAQDVTQFAKVAILARHVIAGVFPAAFREAGYGPVDMPNHNVDTVHWKPRKTGRADKAFIA